jgi:hypothetical protein
VTLALGNLNTEGSDFTPRRIPEDRCPEYCPPQEENATPLFLITVFFLVPKLPFGNPLLRNSVSHPAHRLNAKQSFAEVRTRTEFGHELHQSWGTSFQVVFHA